MEGLRGNKFVICGGSQGIGRSIIEVIEQYGANVINVDIQNHGRLNTINCDLSDVEKTSTCLLEVIKRERLVHGLVNTTRLRLSDDGCLSNISEHIKSELNAFLVPTDIIGNHLAKNNGGSIVNVSSILADQVATEQPLAYHCAKASINQLSRFYGQKLGAKGVRVNTVSPGLISKEHREKPGNTIDSTLYQKYLNFLPAQSTGAPSDVGNLVAFLLSANSFFINCENIKIDGGQHCTELLSAIDIQ
jgi:NAD(P)-dependent dehydrogenase (short-subunit alcohol dehydrogenase family)